LQVRLDATQQAVATASAEYQAAVERARALEGQEATLVRRAANAVLLSDRLDLQAASVQVSLDRQQAQIEAAAMGEALRQGQAELKALQDEAAAASFNRPAATVLAAPIPATTTTAPAADPATPAPAGNWVFPVGGGPDVVSVSHWHHDYPAADI